VRSFIAAAAALAAATALTARSTSPSSSDSADGGGRLTVWIMKDSVSDAYLQRFKKEFEQQHKGTALDIQIQEWDGIGEKVTAALASKDAPDVIEVGNTQVARYAASGGVTDLVGKVEELKGADWLPGLAEPGGRNGLRGHRPRPVITLRGAGAWWAPPPRPDPVTPSGA
jgi:N,N'-diacetylchitobiose transport system substrate-binding protein